MRAIHMARLEKARPVLVLTRSTVSTSRQWVTVAPITSTMRGLSSEVPVGPVNGLDHDSVVNCDAIETIHVSGLGRQIGTLLDDQEAALATAIRHAFDLSW